MFSYVILLLFCGVFCNAKNIFPPRTGLSKIVPPRTGLSKAFLPQGENREETVDDATLAYLNHGYYSVTYSPLVAWNETDISKTGNESSMSNLDDPPPFEVVSIKNNGWVFPFYGHAHPVVYIDSNGFLSMVPRYCPHFGFCNWQEPEGNHDSQYQRYIAPMMTDFNPSRFGSSKVQFQFDTVNNEKQLTVQWSNVLLFSFHNASMNVEKDGFTFQAILRESGDITFNYKKLPYYPGNRTLTDNNNIPKRYPIVLGLEDAVIVKRGDKNVLADYRPLNLDENKIFEMMAQHGGVTVKHRALPTCPEFTTCKACVNHTIMNGGVLKCGWCSSSPSICADIMGRESSSLSAGCLANKLMLNTFEECDNIGKVDVVIIDDTVKTVLIVVIIVIILCLIILCCKMRKMRGQLAEYSKGIPQDAESADRAKNIPGMKNSSIDDHKVEMSA